MYIYLLGLSYGVGCTSFLVTISAYFVVNRSRAIAIGMAFAAVGPIVYPMIISFLLAQYGAQACIAIMVAISTNTIVAALLLQPVKQHLRVKNSEEEEYGFVSKQKDKTTKDKRSIFRIITIGITCFYIHIYKYLIS